MFLMYCFSVVAIILWVTADRYRVESPRARWQREENLKQKIRDLEIDFKEKPASLRFRTIIVAFFGYSVIFAVIFILAYIGVATLIGLFNQGFPWNYLATVGLAPIFCAGYLLRALLFRSSPPSGVRVYPADAPQFFKLIRKIQKSTKGPPFHEVYITSDMNASVSRYQGLWGFMGFGDVVLSLGLPLLQTLSVNQLAAVIAHEYGHVAAKHNALAHWVYRIRYGWMHLGERFKNNRLWYVLRLHKFYQKFIHVFGAYSFVLSRRCEYEADRFAADLVGAGHLSMALCLIEKQSERIETAFWRGIWQHAETMPDPNIDPYQELKNYLVAMPTQKYTHPSALDHEVDPASTHPSMPERLEALSVDIGELQVGLQEAAADKLLSRRYQTALIAAFDRAWRLRSKAAWQARYRRYKTAKDLWIKYQSVKLSELTDEQLLDLANAANTLDDTEKIVASCTELLRREPKHMSAKAYLAGTRLLHQNEAAALLTLDEVCVMDPMLIPVACDYAVRYLTQQERFDEAAIYKFRIKEWKYQNQAAEEERQNFSNNDHLKAVAFKTEYMDKINQHLKKYPLVKQAWLVQKEVYYQKDQPLFIIGLKPRRQWWWMNKALLQKQRQAAVNQPYFGRGLRFFWVDEVKGLEQSLNRVRGSIIYRK